MLFIRPLITCIAVATLAACICPLGLFLGLPDTGTLRVEIGYSGDFYIETFNYSPDAENIRHFVVVIPASEADGVDADWIFSSLELLPDGITVREDRAEYAWALDYVYEAPGGIFTGEFAPGEYAVAVSFIAGPISRDEAGVDDDVILYPGITGGGASNDFQTVTVAAGETTRLSITLTDDDGWACPWLYVFDGSGFERRTEILRHLRGAAQERTEITPIGPVRAVDGYVVVRLAEEKDELSFIDSLALITGGETIQAESDPLTTALLASDDGRYLTLAEDATVDVRFRVPAGFSDGDTASVVVTGYYEPR